MLPEPESLVEAVAQTAARWQDPAYPPRAAAVAQALAAPDGFTEEATAFALNQQMSVLTADALRGWLQGRRTRHACTVGVLHAGAGPVDGLQDALATLLVGHRYLGVSAASSLVPRFLAEVERHLPGLPVALGAAEALFEAADAVVATCGREGCAGLAARCEAHGLPVGRQFLRAGRTSVAVLDGHETEEEREGLAEDALLYDGRGSQSVALVWAPAGLAADPYFDAFAAFRGVFPAHPDAPGRLKMQQAWLAASGTPHAYGEGLEFLVSRGAPEVQPPGHLRWVAYEALDEVRAWLARRRDETHLVVARGGLASRLPETSSRAALGEAQRPPLGGHPGGADLIAFLAGLTPRAPQRKR